MTNDLAIFTFRGSKYNLICIKVQDPTHLQALNLDIWYWNINFSFTFNHAITQNSHHKHFQWKKIRVEYLFNFENSTTCLWILCDVSIIIQFPYSIDIQGQNSDSIRQFSIEYIKKADIYWSFIHIIFIIRNILSKEK